MTLMLAFHVSDSLSGRRDVCRERKSSQWRGLSQAMLIGRVTTERVLGDHQKSEALRQAVIQTAQAVACIFGPTSCQPSQCRCIHSETSSNLATFRGGENEIWEEAGLAVPESCECCCTI